MSDYIDRQAAIDAIEMLILPQTKGETAAEEINRVAWRCAINCAEEMIGHLPTIDPVKHGRWEEKTVNTCRIDEWQSARCSVCGRYHTTPYMYYFTDFKYCPNCGKPMEEQ